MSKKTKKKKTKKKSEKVLKSDVKKHIAAVVLLMVALIFSLSLFGQAGIVGRFVDKLLTALFGTGKYTLPILMVFLGALYFRRMEPIRYALATGGIFLLFLSGLGLLHIFYDIDTMTAIAKEGRGGGYVGMAIAFSLIKLIGRFAGVVFAFCLALIGFMLLFNASVFNLFYKIKDNLNKRHKEGGLKEHSGEALISKGEQSSSLASESKQQEKVIVEKNNTKVESSSKKSLLGGMFKSKKERTQEEMDKLGTNIKSFEFTEDIKFEEGDDENNQLSKKNSNSGKAQSMKSNQERRQENDRPTTNSKWEQPALSIFEQSKGSTGENNIEENIEVIQRTLQDFGITVEPAGHNVGPTVTQYTFSPPPGVMLSKIVNLQNNLALSLASPAIRIEAPIPGTSLVGIEVPNSKPTMIRLGGLLGEDEFRSNDSALTIVLGKDVNGNSVVASLDDMPHVLVAGSTNTGKSVSINAILSALIFNNSPNDLQLILVDPKRVELSFYNGIPHLLTKVIVDMNKVVNTLKWATTEMDARYKLLEQASSKNIISYNKKVKQGGTRKVADVGTGVVTETKLNKMPYIVIVIDELADLMATHGKEVEALIVRLSQMARAVGIHLILSTQRPDTTVITGTIKNNIPARIAFKVASQIDSRTILDRPGAEKLLGNGDMLYMGPGYPQPVRIQGPFISESETRKLIKAIKKQAKKNNFTKDEDLYKSLESKLEEVVVSGDVREGEKSDDDVLYPEAKELVIQAEKASISAIQRKLRIGYNRAARIVDLLEQNGVVGPGSGSKPREVLIASEQMVDEVSGPEDDIDVQAERDRRQF